MDSFSKMIIEAVDKTKNAVVKIDVYKKTKDARLPCRENCNEQVQLAGHRYISSIEAYKQNEMDGLSDGLINIIRFKKLSGAKSRIA